MLDVLIVWLLWVRTLPRAAPRACLSAPSMPVAARRSAASCCASRRGCRSAFLVWYLAGPILAWPIGLLTEAVLKLGFADLVARVQQEGHLLTIVSTLKPALATTAGARQRRALGGGQSAALQLRPAAARGADPRRARAASAAQAAPWATWCSRRWSRWGLIAEFLKHVVFDTAPAVAAQTGFGPLQREVIAFAYQFGSLILPTVAPAVFWMLTHRAFLERFTLRRRRARPTRALVAGAGRPGGRPAPGPRSPPAAGRRE